MSETYFLGEAGCGGFDFVRQLFESLQRYPVLRSRQADARYNLLSVIEDRGRDTPDAFLVLDVVRSEAELANLLDLRPEAYGIHDGVRVRFSRPCPTRRSTSASLP